MGRWGDKGTRGLILLPNYQLPTTNYQCPMPNPLCPTFIQLARIRC
ncbi:MAG: histidine kinase [Cyanobacteria bacterium P01_C01_bin.38]